MQKATNPRAQERQAMNSNIPSQECSPTTPQCLSDLKPATSVYPRSKTSSCPTPQKELDNSHVHRLCSHAEHLKGNFAVLPPSPTQDTTVGKQALPDHHHGGVSEGKCCFSNVLLFRLGTSSDNKGNGALQRTQSFKNKQFSCIKKH